jgi:hypothetical protein
METDGSQDRRWQAYKLRHDAAMAHSNQPFPSFPTTGDEDRYPNKLASYTKGLPHNQLGEVDLEAYRALMHALASGQSVVLEALPLGGRVKLASNIALGRDTAGVHWRSDGIEGLKLGEAVAIGILRTGSE